MILGTADVFSVDQRTAALISHRMRRSSAEEVEAAMKLAAMSEFCIYEGAAVQAGVGERETKPSVSNNGAVQKRAQASPYFSACVEGSVVAGCREDRTREGDRHILHMHEKFLSPTAHVKSCGNSSSTS